MMKAIIAVREGEIEYKVATKGFSIPKSTLKDFVKFGLFPKEYVSKKFGRKLVFSAVLQKILVE